MPEFRDRYDTTTVSGRISQPPFADLVHRGRRRVYRTRTARFAGVAVVVALAAAPLLTLPGGAGQGTSAASSPSPQRTWIEPPAPGYPLHLEFLNLDYGVVTYDVRAPGEASCTGWLAVTSDGGSTWSELREVPTFPGEGRVEAEGHCVDSLVTPIAPDTLVLLADSTRYEYGSVGVDLPTMSYISYDSGQAWQEYEPQVRTADRVPDEVVPRPYCEELAPGVGDDPTDIPDDWCVDGHRVGWLDPQTGDQMVLENNPPASYYGLTVGHDGSIWANGHDSDGDIHISVSRDRGRSWQDASPVLDQEIDEQTHVQLETADGDTAYFTVDSDRGDSSPTQIYRTTDGGETWQSLPAERPFTDVLNIWMTRTGALVVKELVGNATTDDAGYVSHDGGDTFEKADSLTPVAAQRISGGFYGGFDGRGQGASAAADRGLDALSEDGLTWRRFHLPEEPTP